MVLVPQTKTPYEQGVDAGRSGSTGAECPFVIRDYSPEYRDWMRGFAIGHQEYMVSPARALNPNGYFMSAGKPKERL